MSFPHHLTIGARGSKLSLIQTNLVIDALKLFQPDLSIDIKIITTKGDINQAPIPRTDAGKNWFTGEIEQALRDGEIDLAVHSLKDMSLDLKPGLVSVIVLPRADSRDAFISKTNTCFDDLHKGAVIGTDSVRRRVLLLDRRPDLVVKSIRGNVDTRLKKLHEEAYDGIVLAAAGLSRLGMDDVVTEFFDPVTFVASPGQGVLVAQTHSHRNDIKELLERIQHVPTRIEAESELAFSRAVGGGCKTPVGCFAHIEGETITLHGMKGHLTDDSLERKSITGLAENAIQLAEKLAAEFL